MIYYTQSGRQTGRQTGRHTGRQAGKRHTDTQAGRQADLYLLSPLLRLLEMQQRCQRLVSKSP